MVRLAQRRRQGFLHRLQARPAAGRALCGRRRRARARDQPRHRRDRLEDGDRRARHLRAHGGHQPGSGRHARRRGHRAQARGRQPAVARQRFQRSAGAARDRRRARRGQVRRRPRLRTVGRGWIPAVDLRSQRAEPDPARPVAAADLRTSRHHRPGQRPRRLAQAQRRRVAVGPGDHRADRPHRARAPDRRRRGAARRRRRALRAVLRRGAGVAGRGHRPGGLAPLDQELYRRGAAGQPAIRHRSRRRHLGARRPHRRSGLEAGSAAVPGACPRRSPSTATSSSAISRAICTGWIPATARSWRARA